MDPPDETSLFCCDCVLSAVYNGATLTTPQKWELLSVTTESYSFRVLDFLESVLKYNPCEVISATSSSAWRRSWILNWNKADAWYLFSREGLMRDVALWVL